MKTNLISIVNRAQPLLKLEWIHRGEYGSENIIKQPKPEGNNFRTIKVPNVTW
jgi:hypothetical protein